MNHVRVVCLVVAALLAPSAVANAQTTYHLHNEASSTAGLKQLKTAGPDTASVVLQTANLKSTSTGEKLVEDFDTQAGVPGVAGIIPSGSTITVQLWMRKTANVGTLFPRAKVLLNSAAGSSLCTATGVSALTTTLTKFTISCNTSANVTVTAASRFFVWAGANMTAGSTTTNFTAELDSEGTLNGNFDSQLAIPNPVPVPSISGIAPSPGGIGQSVTVSGNNFGASQGTSTLTFFNNKTASPTAWSNTSITTLVPTGAATGTVTVAVGGQTSSGSSFTVLGSPNISSVSPTSGAVGLSTTVNGTNFGASQGTSTVKFNGTVGTPTSWSNTSIAVPVPAGATTGSVIVRVGSVDSNLRTFTVLSSPTISSLSLTSGLPGTAVTIAGTNFGATKGSSTVKFNGTTASTTSWSATSIGVTVPALATTGNVVVTVGGVPSGGAAFTVPTLSSIDVIPHVLTVPVKSQQRYRALGQYSDGVTRDVTAIVTWASSDLAVATIGATGLAVVGASQDTTTVSATSGGVSGATELSGAPSKFRPVSGLTIARHYHTATRLLDGKVLIAGGQDSAGTVTASAELYDPATGRFSATGSLGRRRHLHTATLLVDGTVLISGGRSYNPDEYIGTAEIFDPATGTFGFAGFMSLPRYLHSATRLADGRVLIDGGDGSSPPAPSDIYNSFDRTFSQTGAALTIRYPYPDTDTLLNDGRVLFAGGYSNLGVSAAAEVYDPATGQYSAVPNLSVPRANHSSTLLPDGRVLVFGGGGVCPAACSSEVFDPVAQIFAPGPTPSVGRSFHSATLLDEGLVLVVGGQADGVNTATAEIFDPATNTFTAAGAMAGTRWGQTATLLNDGSVLLVGGFGPLAAWGAELYFPNPIAPISLFVTPSAVVMQPGDSRSFSAIDQLGQLRADTFWSVDNANVATVDPATGVVSAANSGSVVLTAAVGSVTTTAQIAVAAAGALPSGTVRWSTGAPAGSTSTQVVAGAGDGPALFSINAGVAGTQLQALSADGQQRWHTWLPGAPHAAVPNGIGGLLLTYFSGCDGVNPIRLVSIDGGTGIWAWEAVGASTCASDAPQIAVRHDGAVAVATPGNLSGFPGLMILDGRTGTPLSVPVIPQSTFTSVNGQQTSGYSRVGPTMVDVDGTVHVLYEKRFMSYPPQIVTTGIWLMSVRANQSWTTTQLSTTTENTNLLPGRIIPDGNDGLLATWIDSPIVPAGQPPVQSTFRAARVSSGGGVTLFDLPLTPPLVLLVPANSSTPVNPELTLGENDVAFVAYGSSVASFDVNSGAAGWNYTAANGVDLVAAQSDGTLVAKTVSASGPDTILQISSGGGVTSTSLGAANVSHMVANLWMASGVTGGTGAIDGLNINWARSGWFQPSQGGQRRVKGVYRDRPGVPGHQDAAFDMMAALRPRVGAFEWGGLVCKFGDLYKWSTFVSGTAEEVRTREDPQALASCSLGTISADVHLHTFTVHGMTYPSGGDVLAANNNPDLTFYLSAPYHDRKIVASTYIRFKAPVAGNTICYWYNETWVKTSGAGWSPCAP